MPKTMGKSSAPTRMRYASPSLKIYGGMASLTASGSAVQAENPAMMGVTFDKP